VMYWSVRQILRPSLDASKDRTSEVSKFRHVLKAAYPITRHEGAWGEMRYSSYSLSTSALDWGQWSASRLGRALAPGKGPPRYPLCRGLGGPQSLSGRRDYRKNPFVFAGDRTSIARSSSP
jgi:hypothetical protein